MKKQSLYGSSPALLRKFYFSGPVPLNFCNVWYRTRKNSSPAEFFCTGKVRIPVKGEVTFSTDFTALENGSAVIGIGCMRKFTAVCNGVLCCSTLEEGTIYDELSPANHAFLIPVRKGKNHLEVHIMPGSPGTEFCCKVLEKNDFKAPCLPVAPIIGHPDSQSVSITLRTVGNVGSGIEYRIKNTSQWQLLWDHDNGLICRRSLHKFFLKNLQPDSEYEFRAVMTDPADPDRKHRSRIFHFHSPVDDSCSQFSFCFTADTQFVPELQKQLLQGVLRSAGADTCDFLVFGGDINSRYSTYRMEHDFFPAVHGAAGEEKPVVMLRGNHELRGPEPDSFCEQHGDESGLSYRLFRFGDTAFLMLDAWENRAAESPRGKYYSRYNLDKIFLENEKNFVKQAVNSEKWRSARRRIVLAHGASFSQYDGAATMPYWLQDMTDEFFCGHTPESSVDLWLAGHTHIYTRSFPRSSQLAAFKMPAAPQKSGKDYIFPVLTCCGPNRRQMPQLSAFRVDACEDGSLHVRSVLPDGTVFEEINIAPDHTIKELRSLPCFEPEQ